MNSQKRFSQASFPNINYYNVLAGIMILCSTVDAAIQLLAQGKTYFQKDDKITDVILWSIFTFQIRTTEKGSLELVISFLKTYIWDLEFRDLAYSFWDHVIQISFQDVYFQL